MTSPRTEVHTPAGGAEVHGRLTITGEAAHKVGIAHIGLVIAKLDGRSYWNGTAWQDGRSVGRLGIGPAR